jgi:pimeloyl-ACP methyl ester carboxylesterase
MKTHPNSDSVLLIKEPKSSLIVVAFGGINSQMGMPIFEFFNIMNSIPCTKIFVKDIKQAWYLLGIEGTYDINSTVNKLSEILESLDYRNKRVVFLGNSSGGYAAILFGLLLKIDKVIAFSPQTFFGPFKNTINRDFRWAKQQFKIYQKQKNPKYFLDLKKLVRKIGFDGVDIEIYYGVNSILDSKHYKNIKKFAFTFHLYPFGGHQLIKDLKKRGILKQILNNL